MPPPTANPIAAFLERQNVMILDGGLATMLEAHGYDLNDPLWSAKILLEAPDAIQKVHTEFLAAGADCITTSTYQASERGFRKRGLSKAEGVELLRNSVRVALEARDTFWTERDRDQRRLRPMVAASVGPYGAYLADGSEYTGRYNITDSELRTFHKVRWEVLSTSPADLLACETIPSHQEADVILKLLDETPDKWAWMSFSCRDGIHLSDGSRLIDVARVCDAAPSVAAIGINCTSPQFISSLIDAVRKATDKPIIVYPNSGERYDAITRTWADTPTAIDLGEASVEWVQRGANCIGGCCRVGPEEITRLRRGLVV